jgi:hypothetical protein
VTVRAVGGWLGDPPPAVPYQVADCHLLIVPRLLVDGRRPQIRCVNVPQTVRQVGHRPRQPPTLAKVPAEPPLRDDLRVTFQGLLNLALTRGRVTPAHTSLEPDTCAAIDVVAYEHPHAEPECIAAAYEAFESEHG